MPFVEGLHYVLEAMRERSRFHGYEYVYLAFEDGDENQWIGPFEPERGAPGQPGRPGQPGVPARRGVHAERVMIDQMEAEYRKRQAYNAARGFGPAIQNVIIFSFLSPCDEENHKCVEWLLQLPATYPVTNAYSLGFHRYYEGHDKLPDEEKAKVRRRSEAAITKLAEHPQWFVYHVQTDLTVPEVWPAEAYGPPPARGGSAGANPDDM